MQRLQAFKFELRPAGEQQHDMRSFAGSCRFVFNKALALQKERYEQGEKKLGYADLCKLLTEWRNSQETAWLADAPTHPLQQALKDLERAYSNFFAKRAAFPRFKKKGQHDSFRYPDPKQIKLDQANGRIFLPKLGWIRYRNSRDVPGSVKNATVSHSCGKWFVSIQTERELEQPTHPSTSIIGIDMGIARFATLSDGTFHAPLNSFKRHEIALRKAQQAMSRKQKFSSNWRKAKTRVQRIHSRIANARRDFLHKTSTTISQNHAMVCIEDLQVKNMSRSAAGTSDTPGRNVRVKSGLNKSILDQGWSEFRRQLDYKLAWNGGMLIAVPPQNTSRTCPCCGHVSADNRQTQSQFECVECGFEENADVVGAINILRAGHARCACEVSGAVMPPAAGTHRSDSDDCRLSAVGISRLQAGEDVNREAYLPRPLPMVGQVVEQLGKAGFFRMRGVLIGTVAYQCYSATLGRRLDAVAMQTGDADFAQFHEISVAIKDSMPPILEVLRHIDPTFREVPIQAGDGVSSQFVSRDNFKVEFLTPNQWSDDQTGKPVPMPALGGAAAFPLRFLDYLIYEPIRAVLLYGAGVPVLIPSPERYAIHKLIVGYRRKQDRDGTAKSAKDRLQARSIIEAMIENRQHADLASAFMEAWDRGDQWRNAISASIATYDDDFQTLLRTEFAKGVSEFDSDPANYDLADKSTGKPAYLPK